MREAARPERRSPRWPASAPRWPSSPTTGWCCCPSPSPRLTLLAARAPRLRAGFWVGFVFGTAFMLVLLPWLQVIGVYAWIPLAVIEGLFYGLAGLATGAVVRLPWWPLWAATAWVAVEALRAVVPFGGLPVGPAGVRDRGHPGGLDVRLRRRARRRRSWSPCSAPPWRGRCCRRARYARAGRGRGVGAGSLWPAWRRCCPWAPHAADDPRATVAAVQGNVPGEGLEAFAERRAVLDNHVDATLGLGRPGGRRHGAAPGPRGVAGELLRHRPLHRPERRRRDRRGRRGRRRAAADGRGGGGPGRPGLVQPGDRLVGRRHGPAATTTRPTRCRSVSTSRSAPCWRPGSRRWTRSPTTWCAAPARACCGSGRPTVGVLMCFEVAYDGLLRDLVDDGADVIVVPTNNATYTGTGQVEQQFAMSRLRAIETGRYVVVASTNGISGIVAPDGSVVERAPSTRAGRARARRRADPRPHPGHRPGSLARAGAGGGVRSSRSSPACWSAIVGGRASGDDTDDHGRHGPTDEQRRPSPWTADLGRVLMVVPTYNERDNLEWIVRPAARGDPAGRRARRRRRLPGRHRRAGRRAGGAPTPR